MAIWEKLFSKITFKNYPDTSTPLNATNLNAMTDAIDGLDDRVLNILGDMASQYDNTSTYAAGEYVVYDGLLYKCITDISVAEKWDSNKWQKTNCGTEFSTLNSNLENITKVISGSISEGTTTVGVSQNIYYRKVGKIVELWTIQNVNASAPGYYALDLKIPEGFRPSGAVINSVTMKSGTTYNIGRVTILPDGGVEYDIGATGLREFKWQMSYIVLN